MITKTKILGATAMAGALLIVGTIAFAEGGRGDGQGRMGGMGHGQMGHGQMGQGHGRHGQGGMMGQNGDMSERLKTVKAEIGIRAEQETAWETYAKVVTEISEERRSYRELIDRDAVHKMEPQDRQAFRKSMQEQRDASFAKVGAAAETLIAQLDDVQKDKARPILPGLAGNGRGHGQQNSMMGGQGQGPRHGQGHQGGRGMGPTNSQ
jgi:hypothetical protein